MGANWYNTNEVLSFNALFNFIDTVRNVGKTTSLKIRCYKRYFKHHKKAIWVRRFNNETKKAKKNFYKEDICKILGIKQNDIELKGDYLYAKDKKGRKDWFIQFITLSRQQDDKGDDDINCDTIIFDEYRTTKARYKRYRGNEVEDFLNLYYTKSRFHKTLCFFLGNKDATYNPYLQYFGIEIEKDFEGIKLLKEGTICVHQINTQVEIKKDAFLNKRDLLIKNTSFDGYINEGNILSVDLTHIAKTPNNARLRLCFDIRGQCVSLYATDTRLYVKRGIDKNRQVITLTPSTQYNKNYVLTSKDAKYLDYLIFAYKTNALYYDTEYSAEAFAEVLQLLNLI